ncbi:MAG: hypothetical protein ABI876_17660, partial [Bacteroidota bacterium]
RILVYAVDYRRENNQSRPPTRIYRATLLDQHFARLGQDTLAFQFNSNIDISYGLWVDNRGTLVMPGCRKGNTMSVSRYDMRSGAPFEQRQFLGNEKTVGLLGRRVNVKVLNDGHVRLTGIMGSPGAREGIGIIALDFDPIYDTPRTIINYTFQPADSNKLRFFDELPDGGFGVADICETPDKGSLVFVEQSYMTEVHTTRTVGKDPFAPNKVLTQTETSTDFYVISGPVILFGFDAAGNNKTHVVLTKSYVAGGFRPEMAIGPGNTFVSSPIKNNRVSLIFLDKREINLCTVDLNNGNLLVDRPLLKMGTGTAFMHPYTRWGDDNTLTIAGYEPYAKTRLFKVDLITTP